MPSEMLSIPYNGNILGFRCGDGKLTCSTYAFLSSECAFHRVSSDSCVVTSKEVKLTLLACDVVVDSESFVKSPCALLSYETKSKDIYKLYILQAGKLNLRFSWKHFWEGGTSRSSTGAIEQRSPYAGTSNIKIVDGPSVLLANGKILLFRDQKTTAKGFESMDLSEYFDALVAYGFVSTRTTPLNALLVLIRYSLSVDDMEQTTNFTKYALFSIEGADSSTVKTYDISYCIPPIYFSVICDVACTRIKLKQDFGARSICSEIHAITSANQIVQFENGKLKQCGAIQETEGLKVSRLEVFTSADQHAYGCVMMEEEKSLLVDLETYAIVDQGVSLPYVFIDDFLGNGAEQIILAESMSPHHWHKGILTDGSLRYCINKGKSPKKRSQENVVGGIDPNSQTAMKALSNRIRSGRGHLLEMKREVVLRELIIKNTSSAITAASLKLSAVQDDLVNPFGDDEIVSGSDPLHHDENDYLEISRTWVKQKLGLFILGVTLTNLSGKALHGLQLIVTKRDDKKDSVQSQSKLLTFVSENDGTTPSKKRRKKEFSIGMKDIVIAVSLQPGCMGYVVAMLPKAVLSKAVCTFDAFLTWHFEKGTVLYHEVAPFELKMADLLNGSGNISIDHESGKDLQSQLEAEVAFFCDCSLVNLVVTARFSCISGFHAFLTDVPLHYCDTWKFWRGDVNLPWLLILSESDTKVVLKTAFKDTSQITYLLVCLFDILPCDAVIKPHQEGTMSSHQTELLKCLHQEARAIRSQLQDAKGTLSRGSSQIDFASDVDDVRQQMEQNKQRLLQKRKASDEETIEVLSQTVTDLQVHTDEAAKKLVTYS